MFHKSRPTKKSARLDDRVRQPAEEKVLAALDGVL
jgi:hypothetical protein